MSIYNIDNKADPIMLPDYSIEMQDPSLSGAKSPSIDTEILLNLEDFKSVFLSKYNLDYICDYSYSNSIHMRVVTHPYETNTCFEKAKILGSWDPLNIIKVFYLDCSTNNLLYAVVVPETGCFIDRSHIKQILKLPENAFLKKANELPTNMSFGTCSPFILDSDLVAMGGRVEKIIFDRQTLWDKKKDMTLDDFSFGLDHRMSIQMNYYDCFKLLENEYSNTVIDADILNLSFKEKLVRNKGKIKIEYEFNSLNYRTAKFINGIHGFGDVSIVNDYIDELNLPDVLTESDQS